MQRVAQFEKVSFEQFVRDWKRADAREVYETLRLPQRATAGSAGYDFFSPDEVILRPRESRTLPTGFRVRMDMGWVLQIYPRSGHGYRYRLQLDNTVGIIDADYSEAENEGHIILQLSNDGNQGKVARIHRGEGIAQGIFLPFGVTRDDKQQGRRIGGFGSTSVGSAR